MELRDRNDEPVKCKNQKHLTPSTCDECKRPIIIHCPDCNTQVTGCNCTLNRKLLLGDIDLETGGIH